MDFLLSLAIAMHILLLAAIAFVLYRTRARLHWLQCMLHLTLVHLARSASPPQNPFNQIDHTN